MALINNKYIFVQSETIDRSVETSMHPVEKGLSLTDNVRRASLTIKIKGEIVGGDAKKTVRYLTDCMDEGKPVKYQGNDTYSRTMIILDISTEATNRIRGGYSVDMTIQEIRVAKSSYKKKKKSKTNTKTKNGTKQVTENKKGAIYHTVKKGENPSVIVKKYKSLGCTLDFFMKNNNNTKVLGRKGDWRTMRIGAKVLVGYRK